MPATLRWLLGTRQGGSKLRTQAISFCWPLGGVDTMGTLILFKCTTVRGQGEMKQLFSWKKKPEWTGNILL